MENKNVKIASFYSYNTRRYCRPWVCKLTKRFEFDFSEKVGFYDAEDGESGDLIVYEPEIGAIYAYGQKDYRQSKNTWKEYKMWTENGWRDCTRTGKDANWD